MGRGGGAGGDCGPLAVRRRRGGSGSREVYSAPAGPWRKRRGPGRTRGTRGAVAPWRALWEEAAWARDAPGGGPATGWKRVSRRPGPELSARGGPSGGKGRRGGASLPRAAGSARRESNRGRRARRGGRGTHPAGGRQRARRAGRVLGGAGGGAGAGAGAAAGGEAAGRRAMNQPRDGRRGAGVTGTPRGRAEGPGLLHETSSRFQVYVELSRFPRDFLSQVSYTMCRQPSQSGSPTSSWFGRNPQGKADLVLSIYPLGVSPAYECVCDQHIPCFCDSSTMHLK